MPVSIHLTVLAEARSPIPDGRWRTLNAWWREPDGTKLEIDEEHDIFYGGEAFDVMRERPALIVKLTPPFQWRESWPILLPKTVREPGAITCAADGYAYLPVDAAYETYCFMDVCAGKYDEVMAPNFCTLQQLDDSTFEKEFRRPHYRDLKKVCNRIWKRAQSLSEQGRVSVSSKDDVRLVYWYFYVQHNMPEDEETQSEQPIQQNTSNDDSLTSEYSSIDEYNYGDLSLSSSLSSSSPSSSLSSSSSYSSLSSSSPSSSLSSSSSYSSLSSSSSSLSSSYSSSSSSACSDSYDEPLIVAQDTYCSNCLDPSSNLQKSHTQSEQHGDGQSNIDVEDSENVSVSSSTEMDSSSEDSSDTSNIEFQQLSQRLHSELQHALASRANLLDQKNSISNEFAHYFSETTEFDETEQSLPDLIEIDNLCNTECFSDNASSTSSLPDLISTEQQQDDAYNYFLSQIGVCADTETKPAESYVSHETEEFVPLEPSNSCSNHHYCEDERRDMGNELDDMLAEIERHVDHNNAVDVSDDFLNEQEQHDYYVTQPHTDQWSNNVWFDSHNANASGYTNNYDRPYEEFVAIDIPAESESAYTFHELTDARYAQPAASDSYAFYQSSFVDAPIVNTYEQQQQQLQRNATQVHYQKLNIGEPLLPVSYTYLFVGRDGEELCAGSEWLANIIQKQTLMSIDMHHIEAPLSEQDQLSIARRVSVDNNGPGRSMHVVRIRCNTTSFDQSMVGFVHYLCTIEHVTVVLEYLGSLSNLITHGTCLGHTMPWDFDYIVLCPSAPYPDVDASLSLMEVTEERRQQRLKNGSTETKQTAETSENERHRRWLTLIAEMRPGDALLVPCNERENYSTVEEGTALHKPLVLKSVFEKLKIE